MYWQVRELVLQQKGCRVLRACKAKPLSNVTTSVLWHQAHDGLIGFNLEDNISGAEQAV